VLADALVEADSDDPDLIIDAATLTGSLLYHLTGYRDPLP
jgi:leucyl aminopeptidase